MARGLFRPARLPAVRRTLHTGCMSAFVTGSGPPLVLVPGIQGRWEWMMPAIVALGRRHTVLTFSLGDVTGDGLFERWSDRIDELTAGTAGPPVPVVGVSFGGLVAAYYASCRPRQVSVLVLVSTPGPSWRLDRRLSGYARHPRLALPLFASRAAGRLLPEIRAAIPGAASRVRFCGGYAFRSLRFPVSPRQMAAVVPEWERTDFERVARAITAPTLVVTGEPQLDHVVPVESTREYLRLIPGARHAVLPGTGHLGLVTTPAAFARVVGDFVEHPAAATARMEPSCA